MSSLFIVLLWVAVAGAETPTLSGKWRIQSLGSFRDVVLTHAGAILEARRTLWPEFDGEKYQLEHHYRGRIAGASINGELYVREDGQGEFESLRPFTGSVDAGGAVILDGMPIERAP